MKIFFEPEVEQFLRKKRLGVLSTIDTSDNTPEVSLDYYVIDEGFNIFILTAKNSRKYKNILKNKNVAFLIGQEVNPVVMQIKGEAEIIENTDLKLSLVEKLVVAANNSVEPLSFYPNFYPDSKTEIIRIKILQYKYTNFSNVGDIVIRKNYPI